MKNDCVFCAIAEGEIPAFKIFEDEFALAYLDINPFSRGHVLVIPRRHAETIEDLSDEELGRLASLVKKIASHVKATLPCEGFNILQNNGEAAGQTVKHVHFHIVPRQSPGPIEFENHPADMQELKELSEKLKL